MTRPSARRPSGFDYGFRPASYFDNLDRSTVILASILGEERRKDVEARLASGDFDPLVWGEWLTESRLDDETRRLFGQVHPGFMGGEYLPALGEDEIEIARIVCASIMQDVTSVRAQRRGARIHYRVVDEHGGEFTLKDDGSAQPLSLGELINLIDGSDRDGDGEAGGLVFSILRMNLENGAGREEMRGFIAVASCFYPELARYYEEAISGFLDGWPAENDPAEEGVA